MNNILSVGITTHGNRISDRLIETLCGQPVNIIISEDLDDLSVCMPEYFSVLSHSGVHVEYVFSPKCGIANNRQNILNHVRTKFLYIIDNDDFLEADFVGLNAYLSNTTDDVLYIKCYEDGKYMHIPRGFIYMCTWMQIFNTEWLKRYGGYVQSWNFIHEECATNLNLRANRNGGEYRRSVLPKSLISYKYHACGAGKSAFDVSKVCDFVENIPDNPKILQKKKFLTLFWNFCRKYISVYRINGDTAVMLTDVRNGCVADILAAVRRVQAHLKERGI